jgi:hypothetical protein
LQEVQDLSIIEAAQGEHLAARADGGQKTAGCVSNQQQKRLAWGLFQHLQKRIRGTAVEIVGSIHDDDAPPAFGRREPQEASDPAHVLDDYFLAQLAPLFVEAAFERKQIGMPA